MSDHHHMPPRDEAYSNMINDLMVRLFDLEPLPGSCCKMHFLLGVMANLNAGVILNATMDGEETLALEAMSKETRAIVEALLPQKAEMLRQTRN